MKTTYLEFEEKSMQQIAQAGGTVLDVGGGSRFMKGMKKYEPLFVNCSYKTMDISTDYGPDIVGDIHGLPLEENSIDAIICRSVLEHVRYPDKAAQEMFRVLKPGGLLFVQVPSTYPYHARTGHGAYPDYWRFFESTLREMFSPFSTVEVVRHGGWFSAMAFFLPLQAKLGRVWGSIAWYADRIFHTEKRTTTPILYCLAKK